MYCTFLAAIFDMDGTLVDSGELAYLASLEGLTDYYRARGLDPVLPSREEIRSLVGLPSLEYFAKLVPPDRRGDAPEIRRLVAGHEVRRLSAGLGRLYPGVRETLGELRREGWRLGLVSNCGRIYLEANLKHLLDGLLDVALCLDDRPTKTENVTAALSKLGVARGVMVGDRSADLEAGRRNGLRTVGCAYGFAPHEIAGADAVIREFAELRSVLRSSIVATS